VPYRPRLEEEVGGDPHATYAYITADVAAKEKGTEPGSEVRRPGRARPRGSAQAPARSRAQPGRLHWC